MATKRRSDTKQARNPPEKITIPYLRASDFKHLIADGAMVRCTDSNAAITLYVEDRDFEPQEATKVKRQGQSTTYSLNDLSETPVRMLQGVLHMPLQEALKLALVLLSKGQEQNPELMANLMSEGDEKQ